MPAPIPFEEACLVIEKIRPAVDAIRAEFTKLGVANSAVSKAEQAAKEAEDRRQAAHADCAAVNARLIEARRELEVVTKAHDEKYNEYVAVKGRLDAARSAYVELQQRLA